MARSTMNQIIRHLRVRINDAKPSALASDEQYAGDTIRLTGTYTNLSGTATDPTSPTITITDPDGTVRINAATPTKSATGVYYYDYGAIASVAGQWQAEFAGTVSGNSTKWTTDFLVYTEPKYTWTDDELQQFLDLHRVYVRRELLRQDPDDQVFHSSRTMLEGDASTWSGSGTPTDVINIWDSTGADASVQTPDNFNLIDGSFTWDSEQTDAPYYLDAYSYNIHGAIAECMESLAMDTERAKSWSRGGVSYTNYDFMELAKFHRSMTGARSTTIARTYRTR